jgi:hypothetical protein
MCSQRGVMWQTDATGLWKSDLGLLSHLLSPRQLQQESENFQTAPVYFCITRSSLKQPSLGVVTVTKIVTLPHQFSCMCKALLLSIKSL